MRNRFTTLGITFGLLGLLAACGDSTPTEPTTVAPGPEQPVEASASAQGASVERIPFEGPFFNECALDGTGEWVDLTGIFHEVHRRVIEPTKAHVLDQIKFTGTGVGRTTGDVYRVKTTEFGTQTFNATLDGAVVQSFRVVFHLVGPGKGNNLHLRTIFHFTFNANGERVVRFRKQSVTCR